MEAINSIYGVSCCHYGCSSQSNESKAGTVRKITSRNHALFCLPTVAKCDTWKHRVRRLPGWINIDSSAPTFFINGFVPSKFGAI